METVPCQLCAAFDSVEPELRHPFLRPSPCWAQRQQFIQHTRTRRTYDFSGTVLGAVTETHEAPVPVDLTSQWKWTVRAGRRQTNSVCAGCIMRTRVLSPNFWGEEILQFF